MKGWYMTENPPTTEMYNVGVLTNVTRADAFRTEAPIQPPSTYGFTNLEVLPILRGLPWDQCALNLIHSLRPSTLRIVPQGHPVTDNSVPWRVTVYLYADNRTIRRIDQEVMVGLEGATHAFGLDSYLHTKVVLG